MSQFFRTVAVLLMVLVAIPAFACEPTQQVQQKQKQSVVSQTTQTVNVTVESKPTDGEVYVDGKFVGTAPMSVRLTPGAHSIEVVRDEFESWKRELTVIRESPTRVTALLKKK